MIATDLKTGITFSHEGRAYRVVKYNHIKVGRGGANVRVSMRNLESGVLEDKTFQSTAKFDEIRTQKRSLQYLYKDTESASFMDPNTFEQVEIPLTVLGDDILYVKEGESADVLYWGDKPLSVELPPKVVMTVVETAPGVKGNSASNMYKPAILDNGVQTKVPLFIKEGDQVRIDTRSAEYVERVS